MAPPPPLRSDVDMFSAGSKKRSMLLQAAYDGDLRSFKKLLMSLDKRSGRLREKVEAVKVEADGILNGAGALHLAAGNGRLEICSYLVEGLRVDVDAVDCAGRTPLLHALFGENVVTFKYLLDHGANQDKVHTDGFAPLHSAAGFGYCEMVELLLAKGAYIDPVTACGTPLHIACTEGQDRTVEILLEHNADYNKMVNGMTPLYFAISATSLKCVKLLVELFCALEKKGSIPRIAMFCLLHCKIYTYSGFGLTIDNHICSMLYLFEPYDTLVTAGAIANGDYILNYLPDAPSNGLAECLNCFLGFGPDCDWEPYNDDARMDQQKIAKLKSQGNEAVKRKDFVSAAEAYTMALELDPDDATLFANRSLCWLHIGKGGKPLLSLLDAYECKKRQPDWPKACYRQSKALMSLKEYKGVCDALLEGLKLDPGNAEIEDELWKAVESMKLSATTKAM